ncbi:MULTISPECIES: hypothetical protein [Edwardsiella]|uniref:Uncharacterized protein n=2 Tax=Edwardsiella anguillarum TaxID=1821960 RepID=A0ABY8SG83_9GAMM|nr:MULTISPECIES: hypothetical protein [Edwardsiella]GAJ67905.1 hypothetical protein MA13_contig00007-0213 [Edwardsiella piscicida]AIJ09096.1 putative chromosome segregation ATPase [Edwardsiella anguillarum ET080813]KAB0587222.1 hypothetical protein F7P84_17865 [Edwardsiella anguillarum]MDA6076150.1 hypothetical protein [Edwardsiella anguillarum]RFS99770.1 hypothetical protein CGL57_18145 [Edwardsiella anguillarum]
MTSPNSQELSIIEAFSSATIPERIIRESNIKELINAMTAERGEVQSHTRQLDALRRQQKNGNFLSNWWNDLDDKVQEAQLDLNKSIGRLTEKSSQLLIVNTAISKVLSDQQRILLRQQNLLKQQTDSLEQQNQRILDQQILLEQQQREINKANQGLMEAKGLTQKQAQQLVGCVKQVREAESRISATSDALQLEVERRLHDAAEQYLAQLDSAITEQQRRSDAFERRATASAAESAQRLQDTLGNVLAEATQNHQEIQQQIVALTATQLRQGEELKQQMQQMAAEQSQRLCSELARFAGENAAFQTGLSEQQQSEFKSVQQRLSLQTAAMQQQQQALNLGELRLQTLREECQQKQETAENQLIAQQKSADRTRLMLGVLATLTLASLGWQAAVHYGLV